MISFGMTQTQSLCRGPVLMEWSTLQHMLINWHFCLLDVICILARQKTGSLNSLQIKIKYHLWLCYSDPVTCGKRKFCTVVSVFILQGHDVTEFSRGAKINYRIMDGSLTVLPENESLKSGIIYQSYRNVEKGSRFFYWQSAAVTSV